MPRKPYMPARNLCPPQSRIIRDCRDGSLDYFLPLAQAKALCAEGKLCWDTTNGAYSHLTPTEPRFTSAA